MGAGSEKDARRTERGVTPMMQQQPKVPGPSPYGPLDVSLRALAPIGADAAQTDVASPTTVSDTRIPASTTARIGIARRWPDLLLTRPSSSPTMSQSEQAFLSGRRGCSD
jgi:hypothetical protein